ncbi:NADPH-dependent FMN reductase [Agrilactobacillus fermenti]|uniref:NADPH-dependent FMN reductase n=1 Tax=Agrilactobacillus fermenti TaxID=2586909 RepID=UPI001E4B3C8C|nr:NAD(P)H-dependent oxidoreductase [Agrilactobacillus fermenti]MCD2257486.1 NAD(P)H-dependent oxidoreductase [Agrilactobacillus fermenti]
MTKIGIILGSIRRNSLGQHIFEYLQKSEPNTAQFEFTWIDLKDYPLDFYEHRQTPLSETITDLKANESAWLDTLKAQDGYIIISPEYDHAIPGSLKNALDYVGPEVEGKPVQIITYSSFSDGGMLAAESMVEILQMLKMIVLPTPVLLWDANNNFNEDGLIVDAENSDHFQARLQEAFNDIAFYTKTLAEAPYQKYIHANLD